MRVLNYIETNIWAMLPSAYDRMHRIVTQHSAEFERVLIEAAKNGEVDKRLLETPKTVRFDITSDAPVIKPNAMLTTPGTRLAGTRYVQMRDGVAIIDLNGVIAMRMNFFQELCEGGTSTEMLAKDFQFCLDSPDVQSIVFLINSPGGEAFGTNEFANQVFNARGKKPIKAYVSGYGCSAAYFIACACDEVIVDAQAMIGSIGVVSEWQDATEMYKMLGIDRKVVTSSNAPKKRLDLNDKDDADEFQSILDAMEDVFIKFVSKARNVPVDSVRKDFGQGSVFIGKDAVKAGMVDKVGSLEGVISSLQKGSRKSNVSAIAENSEINFSVKENVNKMTIKERILAMFADEDSADTPKQSSENNGSPNHTAALSAPAQSGKSPELIAAEQEVARLKAEKAEGKVKAVKQAAETFATAELSQGRMLPAEKAEFIADYAQAAKDDEVSPLGEGTRVARLEARQSARKPHSLTKETINASTNKIVFGQQTSETKEMDDEVEAQVNDYDQQMGGSRKSAAGK